MKHLLRDLDNLRRELLGVGAMVEEAINRAMKALIDRRDDLAHEIIEGDGRIDVKEVQIEEECLKVLALHQPVAADLRFIVAVMKVNNDLERMGDLAVNIAERAKFLSRQGLKIHIPKDIEVMVTSVAGMVRESLDSVVNSDTALARKVCEDDDIVDDLNRQIIRDMKQRMQEDPSSIEGAVDILSASRHLERIADLATNIAEDVIFMVEGDVVRHQPIHPSIDLPDNM